MSTVPDTMATDPAVQSSARAERRWRRGLAWVVLVLGCVVLLIANVAVFARTLVFDTDTFVDVLAPEQPDEEVIAGVADALSDQIVTATAVQDRIQELTPRDNALVAAAVADAAENIIDDTVRAVMQNDRFRDLWHDAVTRAHERSSRWSRATPANRCCWTSVPPSSGWIRASRTAGSI